MKFSRRTDWRTAPNLLAQAMDAKKRSGKKLIDLTESNPTRCGFGYLKSELLKPFSSESNFLYEPDSHGLAVAREAVCDYYAEKKVTVQPDQVFMTAGTSEAYSYIFRLLCENGESILVPQPSYPLFDYLADLNDIAIKRYRLNYEDGWRIDRPSLENAAAGNPKAVILVNPNNPTGNFVRPDELELINRVCRQAECAIISDEVFWDFSFEKGAKDHPSFAANHGVLTFTLSGVSKIMGLPQMKLSWIVVSGPEAIRRQATERLEVIADTYLSVNTPSQRALASWLDAREEAKTEMLERILSNKQYLEEALGASGGPELLKSDGGWYGVIRYDSSLNEEAIALHLLEEQNIIIHPGYFFDFEDGRHGVVSFLTRIEIFREGVNRLTRRSE